MSGTTPTSLGFSYQNEGIRFVKVENVSFGRININSIDQYISEETDKALARSRLVTGDVLFSIAGTIGRTCIVYSNDIPANTNQAFAIIRGTTTVFDQMFLLRQLDSFVSNKTKEKARGGAMNNVSLSDLAELILIIPPIAEQHRIVAKVDELMALCDQLENQHNNAAEAHEKLVTHLLGTLIQSQNAEDFNTHWQRISEHFDTLFTTEASIDALKQTLLQLAVMGKLVPQDPNDEPASELLKRIQAEKAKLIVEGKIKKDKPLTAISEEEKPFDLPAGWVWVRLIDLASLITKGSSPKWQGVNYTNNPDDIMFVTSENVGSYKLLLDTPKYVERKFNDIEPRSILKNGDFLMNIVGASIGRTAVYDLDTLANINQAVCLIRIATFNLSCMFVLHFFNSETCLEYMFDKQVDNARPNLSMGNISKFLIPIPPLVEQHRIVAKVDELMAISDQLRSSVTESNHVQQKLATVLANLVL